MLALSGAILEETPCWPTMAFAAPMAFANDDLMERGSPRSRSRPLVRREPSSCE